MAEKPRHGKPPAFQFYPADWLADLQVRAMTYEERGVYIDLLAFCWREGSIPMTLPELARLLHSPEDQVAIWWERIGPRFNPDGTHRRLDVERRKQRGFSRLQSERRTTGIRNAVERKEKAVDRNATGTRPESTLQSASASASARDIEISTEGNKAGSRWGASGAALSFP